MPRKLLFSCCSGNKQSMKNCSGVKNYSGDKESIKKNNIEKSSIDVPIRSYGNIPKRRARSIPSHKKHVQSFKIEKYVSSSIRYGRAEIRQINTNRKAESEDDNYYSCEEM